MKDLIEKYIGKQGNVIINNMRIEVKILDYKESYGKRRWLITPIAGMGQSWTEQEPVTTE